MEDNLELRKKIKSFLFLRYCFLGQVAKMPSYRIDAFKNIANYIYDEFDTSETYDKYPIDLNLWKAKYEDPDDFLSDIDPVVYDLTQYAIFGKTYNVLYFKKVCEDLEDLYLNETGWISDTTTNTTNNTTTDSIFDEENMDDIDFELLEREGTNEDSDEYSASFAYFYDSSNEFWVLYLNYLNNLNHFMDLYGKSEELLLAKKRLLYAIDKPNVMLFDENNFKNALEDAKDIELDEDPFDFFCDEVKCLSEEAFVIPNDEYTIRKLIFVGTYYALTEDSEIKETVLKYQNDERFAFFYEIMINNCKGKIKECLPEDIKKLLKKKK